MGTVHYYIKILSWYDALQLMNLRTQCTILFFGILAGIVAGYFIFQHVIWPNFDALTDQKCHKDYPLTSEELDCDYDDVRARVQSLDTLLEQVTKDYVASGKVKRMSVWVRDLNSKQWAASNENERFSPASLLKLPLLVTYYKYSEIDPTILSKTITYHKPAEFDESGQVFTKPTPLVEGNSYTVNELLSKMIVDSDNGAAVTLLQSVDQEFYTRVLLDLGIVIPSTSRGVRDFVNTKSYANILRILFTASYLNRDLSEKALELLSHTTFKGISALLPAGTIVAHKFGERTVEDASGAVTTRELHDCGIVYKDTSPYSLCIMTEGSDFKELESIVEHISQTVYDNL